jgi:hypothetical protein
LNFAIGQTKYTTGHPQRKRLPLVQSSVLLVGSAWERGPGAPVDNWWNGNFTPFQGAGEQLQRTQFHAISTVAFRDRLSAASDFGGLSQASKDQLDRSLRGKDGLTST